MKKKILSFIMLFAVTLGFISGCNDDPSEDSVLVVNGQEVVATINGVHYTADDVYGDLITSSSNAAYIYEQLEKNLIDTVIKISDSAKSRITSKIEAWKNTIRQNSNLNGTSYESDLKAALEKEYGVSSEEELFEKMVFELKEETILNQYKEQVGEEYYNSYLSTRNIYHVSQILVSIGENSDYDYFNVEISKEQAEKLYNVINELKNGETFYNVALQYSDDSNSKDLGGDLGIVSLYDDGVKDEVRYALATYSALYENADIELPEYIEETVYANGVEAISEEYVNILGEKYDDSDNHITTSSNTTTLYSRVYARNIIFNNLFNSRTFRFLQIDEASSYTKEMEDILMPLTSTVGFASQGDESQNILKNEENHPILVVRSSQGIHFISINKSAYAGKEELIKYYSTEINRNDTYRTYLEKAIDEADEKDRLAELEGFENDYVSMKVSGNSKFNSGNENFLRYDMFNHYLNGTYHGVEFKITNSLVRDMMERYTTSKQKYIKLQLEQYFDGGFASAANKAKHADNTYITKEIPLLQCLNNKGCTYTYEKGFAAYSAG